MGLRVWVLVGVMFNSSTLSILYYNARNILPKMDDLAASVLVHEPDIVCIIESWLEGDVGHVKLCCQILSL